MDGTVRNNWIFKELTEQLAEAGYQQTPDHYATFFLTAANVQDKQLFKPVMFMLICK